MSNEASILAFTISICDDIVSDGRNSNGLRRNGASSLPKVKTRTVESSLVRILYSVLAGSITKNGNLLLCNKVMQVVVLPQPVTPQTNTCLLSTFLSK